MLWCVVTSPHQMPLDFLERWVGVTVWYSSEAELCVLGGKLAFKIANHRYF